MKPDLVTSNGERLIIQNIVRNGSLWSSVVFEKEVIFHEFDLETSDSEFEVSKSSIWKRATLCDHGATRVFFLSLISCNFDDRLSSNFHRFVILCICWDTPTLKTSLWQLAIVSSVFKVWTPFDEKSNKQDVHANVITVCTEKFLA